MQFDTVVTVIAILIAWESCKMICRWIGDVVRDIDRDRILERRILRDLADRDEKVVILRNVVDKKDVV